MTAIQHVFKYSKVDMTDDSDLWEVLTPDMERIASFENEEDARELEIALNMACTDAAEKKGAVIASFY